MKFQDLRRGMRCFYRWDDIGKVEIIIIDYDSDYDEIEFIKASVIDNPEDSYNPRNEENDPKYGYHKEDFDERFSLN